MARKNLNQVKQESGTYHKWMHAEGILNEFFHANDEYMADLENRYIKMRECLKKYSDNVSFTSCNCEEIISEEVVNSLKRDTTVRKTRIKNWFHSSISSKEAMRVLQEQ